MQSAVGLERNIQLVRERIRKAAQQAGRDPNDITLVAVSKTFPVESIVAAYALGIRDFGENRVEEALGKIPQVKRAIEGAEPLRWHMVGHLQHRKVKAAVGLFDMIHSVDSVALAERLNSNAKPGERLPVLVEVNVSGEPEKYGFSPEPRRQLYAALQEMAQLASLDIRGLMTLAPIVSQPEQARPYFRVLRELRDDLRSHFPEQAWRDLSMGMTDDFEAAVAEGATLVRIGRAIFGERPKENTSCHS